MKNPGPVNQSLYEQRRDYFIGVILPVMFSLHPGLERAIEMTLDWTDQLLKRIEERDISQKKGK